MRARFLLMSLLTLAWAGAAGCPAPTAPRASATPAEAPAASPSVRPSPSPASPRPSPSRDPNAQKRLVFSGTSNLAMEGPFRLVAGDRVFRCTYDGHAALSVYLIRHDGQKDAQLFNREGPFFDAAHHAVSESADFYVQVAGADGPWRLEIE